MHLVTTANELTTTGIALCAFGLCLLATVVIAAYKLVKG
jgi:hypothetical protein